MKARTLRIGRRFYVVVGRDRHKAPFVEVGIGDDRSYPYLLSKHHLTVTLGDYAVAPSLNIDRRHASMNGAVGRVWFEGSLGYIRGLRARWGKL